MRLSELKGYRSDPLYDAITNSYNLREFLENIKQLGYTQYLIAEGYFSGVFYRPQDDYVIKIFQDDKGYEKFLNYVINNKNNPHVPKLRGKPITFLKKYKIVRIEKLSSSNTPMQYITYTMINDYIHDYESDAVWAKQHRNKVEKLYPELIPLLNELVSNRNILDFHKGNMMFRGNIPVITDPYADFTT